MAPSSFIAGRATGTPIRRVLVADDDRDMARGLTLVLELWGFEVTVTHDGLAALTASHQVRPHAVLLDIGLPKLDGLQVARKIREEPSVPRPLLVALTGYGEVWRDEASHQAGFDHYLIKPVEPRHLREVLCPPENGAQGGPRK
jgi:DNA-binding response OmpR family regulator